MSVSVKVCGITREVDADFALQCGASRLGFILYEKSPRNIELHEISNINKSLEIEPCCMVGVQVEPEIEELKEIINFGFGSIQLHFSYDFPVDIIKEWSDMVGPDKLWLAPKLPTELGFPESILPLAETFLIDAYSEDKFGGTGERSNWDGFYRWQREYNSKKWILAGGLSPNNIEFAVNTTDARHVDANSGVEKSPGVKDHTKITNFFTNIP
ncbi:MAG: phosphoribosylanthranilate isomerase [Opitutae bacterium]|jgi:phosphoribosylanthranilate isomerase|nr:phosphoribosylanthranilate isomerase [Opitutae bacterium]MDA8823056.1 phosphoribosylanthranilate isomerase [Opitutales bacterium]